jgi:hypothetical protein
MIIEEIKDAMIIEEIKGASEQPIQAQELQAKLEGVQTRLPTMPAKHRQLLKDMGYTTGVCEVTADQMNQAWTNAVDVDYLAALDLQHCAHNIHKLQSVRKKGMELLHLCNLGLGKRRKKYNGKLLSAYAFVLLE